MARKGKGGGLAAGIGCLLVAVFAVLFAPIGLWILVLASAAGPTVEGAQETSTTCRVVAQDGGGSAASDLRGVPEQWVDDVERAAEEAGMPAPILGAQIGKESSWNPEAVNETSRAAGLAQFIPTTWAAYGKGDPFNPEESIAAMGRYMKVLMGEAERHADGDGDRQLRLALAAYNWGPGNMAGHGWSLEGLPGETTDYLAVILDKGQVEYSQECEAFGVAYDGDLGDGEWASPLPGGTMTSGGAFGSRNVLGLPLWAQNHVGIDLATPNGGKVVAPFDMRVTAVYAPDGCVLGKATTGPAFGIAVCHMDDWSSAKTFKRGDVIGTEGTKAASVGVGVVRHLHLEMYRPEAGDPQYPGPDAPGVIDPTPLLRQKGAL